MLILSPDLSPRLQKLQSQSVETSCTEVHSTPARLNSIRLKMSDELVDIFKFASLKDENSFAEEQDVPIEGEDAIDYHDIMTEEYELNDTRVAMIGNVDSGKSTLIGVLTNATLDDGRGGQ